MAENRQTLSFEEFKLYYESTEKVTDRRLETNRWNYSTCSAILVAVAALVKWGVTSTELRWVAVGAVLFLCITALLFCQLWLAQIRDFKRLNNAKFEILNQMAPLLDLDLSAPGRVSSYRPFEREWECLKEEGAVDKLKHLKLLALKSSHMEQFIPRAFQLVFGVAAAALVLFILTGPPFSGVPPHSQATSQEAN